MPVHDRLDLGPAVKGRAGEREAGHIVQMAAENNGKDVLAQSVARPTEMTHSVAGRVHHASTLELVTPAGEVGHGFESIHEDQPIGLRRG